jgi:hypothetical protein
LFDLRFLFFGFVVLVRAIDLVQRAFDNEKLSCLAAPERGFVAHSEVAGEKELANVGEGRGVAKRDAILGNEN